MTIALLGMGTIGTGVYEIAEKLPDVQLKTILDLRCWMDNMTSRIEDILSDSEIELVVETMGGLHPAYEFAKQVLESGRHFVTANKYLVSVYGAELTALARKNGRAFLYSAACGGGIPYLANLKLAREADTITALGGILNGTTNFILDAMQTTGGEYEASLKEAQALGYAERDPSSDIDGLDTMRKLILADGVGFDAYLSDADIPTRGIAGVSAADIRRMQSQGLCLRLCAFGARQADGALSAYVEPTLLPASAPESAIHSNINYAWYMGENSGLMSYSGQGAGKLPTASNIIRDVRAIAAGRRFMTAETCAPRRSDNLSSRHAYYVRIPAGEAFPAEWIKTRVQDGAYDIIETLSVPVAKMHGVLKDRPDTFFAGIQKG